MILNNIFYKFHNFHGNGQLNKLMFGLLYDNDTIPINCRNNFVFIMLLPVVKFILCLLQFHDMNVHQLQ